MTVFLMIRHGSTDMLGKTLAGWMPDVHLNAEGAAQAERLADRLGNAPITAVYCRPLDRARETAAPVAARKGLQVTYREGLGEIRFGDWTGLDFQELAHEPVWELFNVFRSGTRIPGGEMMLEVQTRIVGELDELRLKHPDGVVAVVSHGDVIKSALAHYAGIPLDLIRRLEISPASVSVVKVNSYGPLITAVNDVGVLSIM